MTRFVVAVTHGWREDEPLATGRPSGAVGTPTPLVTTPLTAMVLDRVFNYEVVKQFRSDAGGWPNVMGNGWRLCGKLNRAAAEMAEQKARELNDALA